MSTSCPYEDRPTVETTETASATATNGRDMRPPSMRFRGGGTECSAVQRPWVSLRPRISEGRRRPARMADKPLLELKNLKTWFYTDEGIAKSVDGVSYSILP